MHGCLVAVLLVSWSAHLVLALDNGVGKKPAMGWSSWNALRCDINEKLIKQVADAIVSSGLKAAGYTYVNIDDCWMEKRDETGRIIANKTMFPSGIKALAAYIHSKGLKFGIYSSAGKTTCEGLPGSWGYEVQDAKRYADWGVDYLKYDFCGMDGVMEPVQQTYMRMRDALNATRRGILYSLASWGKGQPWNWGAQVGNSWRILPDIFAAWDSKQAGQLALPLTLQPIMNIVRFNRNLAKYAGPGAFNDADMLVVGLDNMQAYGYVLRCPPPVPDCKPGEFITRERWGKVGGLTRTQQRSHFSMWCMMASPLILGNDPRNMTEATLDILLAREVIAINQDPLGKQGAPVHTNGTVEVWTKELVGGRVAVLLLNLGSAPANITTVFRRDMSNATQWLAPGVVYGNAVNGTGATAVNGTGDTAMLKPLPAIALVRDVWLRQDLGAFADAFTAVEVQLDEAKLLVISWYKPAV